MQHVAEWDATGTRGGHAMGSAKDAAEGGVGCERWEGMGCDRRGRDVTGCVRNRQEATGGDTGCKGGWGWTSFET